MMASLCVQKIAHKHYDEHFISKINISVFEMNCQLVPVRSIKLLQACFSHMTLGSSRPPSAGGSGYRRQMDGVNISAVNEFTCVW